jgi:hypothetical protein
MKKRTRKKKKKNQRSQTKILSLPAFNLGVVHEQYQLIQENTTTRYKLQFASKLCYKDLPITCLGSTNLPTQTTHFEMNV